MREMRLMRWLRVPAAFVATTWAGLLAVVVLGLVPATAGAQRVMTRLDDHAEEAGAVVLRQLRRTWWRDLPVSLGVLAHLAAVAATVALLVQGTEGAARVFLVGLLVPVHWAAAAMTACYVRAAATLPLDAPRGEVLDAAIDLGLSHPLRALLTVPAVLLAAPTYVLAPLTVACGIAAPAWVVDQVWRLQPGASRPAIQVGPHPA